MTLIAGIVLPDGNVWMGGERVVGTDGHRLAGPKIFQLTTTRNDKHDPPGVPFLIGFAGAPRVAQTILAVKPPQWKPEYRSLHAWLTDYCANIRARCQAELLIEDSHEGGWLVGGSAALVAIDGHLVRIGCNLSWEELDRPYRATGVAWETWTGAYVAHLDHHRDQLTAARAAWEVAERLHNIGPLVDELTLS